MSMKMDEDRQRSEWIVEVVQRAFPHLIAPWFKGNIVSYIRQTYGSLGLTTNYTAKIQRKGEATIDPRDYPVFGNYVPVIGDEVECVWRDQDTAYILGSTIPQQSRFVCRVYRVAAYNLTAGLVPVTMPFDTVDEDPSGSWDSVNNQYVCKADGRYIVSATLTPLFGASTRFIAVVFKTPVGGAFSDVRRGGDDLSSGANNLGLVVPGVRIRCNAGDRLHVGYYSNAAVAMNTNSNTCYAEFAFERGL